MMMKNFTLQVIAVVFLLGVSAFSLIPVSSTGIEEEFLNKFEEANKEMTSIQSDFIQEREMEIMEEPIISTGTFYYKKPSLMKWDQRTPTPYYFIVNGDKVIRFDGKKRKELSINNPQVSYFKDFIMSTVDGSIFKSNQFETMYATMTDIYIIRLTPKDKNMLKRIDKIMLTFNRSDLSLTQLLIIETGGDKMRIKFSNQEFNAIVDSAIFN